MCIAGSITPRLHTFHVYGSSSRPTYFVPNPTPNEANAAGHRGLLLGLHALSSLSPSSLISLPFLQRTFLWCQKGRSERARAFARYFLLGSLGSLTLCLGMANARPPGGGWKPAAAAGAHLSEARPAGSREAAAAEAASEAAAEAAAAVSQSVEHPRLWRRRRRSCPP